MDGYNIRWVFIFYLKKKKVKIKHGQPANQAALLRGSNKNQQQQQKKLKSSS